MALLTVQKPSTAGVALTYVPVSSSDTWPNSGGEFLHVKNAGGSIDNVAIVAVAACNQGTLHNIAVAVPATTGDRMIGPCNPIYYSDPITGLATATHSFTTTVTCAVIGR